MALKEGDTITIKKITRWYDDLDKEFIKVKRGEFENIIVEKDGVEYLIDGTTSGKGSLAGDSYVDNGIRIKKV